MGFTNTFEMWEPFPWHTARSCVRCGGPPECRCWEPDKEGDDADLH